jgi:ATP-dependent Lon protease
MFIATANSLDTIHPALLDRMEIIDISGYSVDEKMQIAKQFLIPRQIKENGITEQLITFPEDVLRVIIEEFTGESGVRNLERAVGSVCRAVAYQYAISTEPENFQAVEVSLGLVEEALGVNNRMDMALHEKITRPGVAIGLAYTTVGGRCLLIETMKYPGNG